MDIIPFFELALFLHFEGRARLFGQPRRWPLVSITGEAAMTIIYTDDAFLDHGADDHPECPRRLVRILDHLGSAGLLDQCRPGKIAPATPSMLRLVHGDSQIANVREWSSLGGHQPREAADTLITRRSYDVSLQAIGATLSAVDSVIAGEDSSALCLIRPPGHHATDKRSMGFCLFNNVAVAARYAQRAHQVGRVLIVDWDVHHGNGTQDIFYEDESVVFFSIHRHPFYPGTGQTHETGSRKGLGSTINVPLELGVSRKEYLSAYQAGLERAIRFAKPDLVLISAGFDAHHADPIGSLGLEAEDYRTLTDAVVEVARTHAEGRVISCLEGGYNLTALGQSLEQHLRGLLDGREAAGTRSGNRG